MVALLVWAARAGWTPVFFVQGQGGTPLRQVVLWRPLAMFGLAAWLMLNIHRRQPSAFLYWYGLGLALLAVGLLGVMLQSVQGSALGWTGRLTQCLGGAYLLIAALVAASQAGPGKLSFAAVEAAWRKGELLPTFQKEPTLWLALRYAFGAATVAAAFGLHQALAAGVGAALPPFILFYPAVMVVALLAGWGPGLLATALTLLVVNVWIVPPIGQWTVSSPADRLALALFAFNGLLICAVAELYRRYREKAAAYEREAALRESREALRRQAELIDPVRAELIAQEMQRVVRERGDKRAPPPEPAGETPRRVPAVAGAVAASAGLLVLIGWTFGVDTLKSVLPGLATMKANTALCFLLAGAALLLLRPGAVAAASDPRNESANGTDGGQRPPLQWAGTAAALVMLLVAGLTLCEYVTGADFGIDQLLFRDTHDPHTIFPGRMVEATALAFLFTGASLLLLGARSRAGRRTQQTLAVCAGVIGVVAVLGYAYNVQQLYRFAGFSSMALHTALSFVLLAAGLIFARPDGLASVLAGSGPATLLARRLLPVALLLPAVLGWLVDRALKHGLYGPGMDIAVLVLAMMLSLAALVWWAVRGIHRADAVRREHETQLRNQAEVMDHAHDALIVREMDGVIRSWNRGAEKLYGWSAPEAAGRHIHALLRCEGTPLVERDAQLAQTGFWEGELVQTSREGRQIVVESRHTASRTPDGHLLILESNRDVTARKQAEEAARRSQKTFAELVERSPFGTYIVDSQFRVAMMNAASQKGAFRNVRPIIGRPLDEAMRILWPEPVAAEIIGHFRHTLETGEPYYSRDFVKPRHDAEIVEVLRMGAASHDAAGRPARRHLLLLRFHQAARG